MHASRGCDGVPAARIAMEPDRASFYALVVGGLEPLVSSSIETALGLAAGSVEPVGVPPPSDWWATGSAARSVWPGAAGCGKLAFSVPRPRDAEAILSDYLTDHLARGAVRALDVDSMDEPGMISV